MKAREGDLIQTANNVIFDVKGLVHPPNKIIAFPRYIPNQNGTRGKPEQMYNKIYNLAERYTYLQKETPELLVWDNVFGEKLCEIPVSQITKHFDPIKKLQTLRKVKKLMPLEQKSLKLATELKCKADISWGSIGISGSIMTGLTTLQSDIDPLVYGSENCRKAYVALETLRKSGKSGFKPYDRNELSKLYDFRKKDTIMTFDDFTKVESRKTFQGMYQGTDYFVRFVKDWSEISEQYGDVVYENVGYIKAVATVSDDSEALFTPCSYQLADAEILEGPKLQPPTEVASFRGRFCQQAKIGEKIIFQGKMEKVTDKRQNRAYNRIIIGGQPADFMALSKL
jgi:uncharacterized protein